MGAALGNVLCHMTTCAALRVDTTAGSLGGHWEQYCLPLYQVFFLSHLCFCAVTAFTSVLKFTRSLLKLGVKTLQHVEVQLALTLDRGFDLTRGQVPLLPAEKQVRARKCAFDRKLSPPSVPNMRSML